MQECHLSIEQIGDLTLVQYSEILEELEDQEEATRQAAPEAKPKQQKAATPEEAADWVRQMQAKGVKGAQ